MGNLIAFINSFLSYVLVMAIIAVIGGVAIFIGINLRKNKDSKNAGVTASAEEK